MLESSIKVTGLLKKEPRAPGGYEISVKDIQVIQAVKEEYPIAKKDHGPDFLLNNRHLWLRSENNGRFRGSEYRYKHYFRTFKQRGICQN